MRTNVVLVAGKGKRFADDGYKLPKPLIPIGKVPMVVAAARFLPQSRFQVFVCSGELVRTNKLDLILKKNFPKSKIIIQDTPLQGQAHSALMAEKVTIPNSILTVGTCDSGVVYSKKKFNQALKDPKVDVLIWGFRNYPFQSLNPTAYGWIEVDQKGFVKKVHYKKPISDNPINDHAVVGHFTYKKASYCFDGVKEMMKHKYKSGSEYSLDECTNVLIKQGLRVKVFEVDYFLCWGTPNELNTFNYWKDYFSQERRI